MNLQDFINDTLAEIVEGIHTAANNPRYWGIIAPGTAEHEKQSLGEVKFDVLVTTESKGKAGLKVLSVLDAGGETGRSNAHRVTFAVPVNFRVNLNEGE